MTASTTRRRKAKPYCPAAADRRSSDFLRNAKLVKAEVDDPYEPAAKILTLRSTRDDPLADMLSRGFISQCEFETGRHWQRAYENSEIGNVGGIDPTKEAVDGGRMREVLTDRQLRANKELKAARDTLGKAGNWLIVSVLGTNKTLEMVAWEWHQAKPGDAAYRYVTRRFHECLGTLAELYGYAPIPAPRRGI
jgi:hypothetical protein